MAGQRQNAIYCAPCNRFVNGLCDKMASVNGGRVSKFRVPGLFFLCLGLMQARPVWIAEC